MNCRPTLLVLFLILPTLGWPATIEERLLVQVFGERYIAYRHSTRMIIPFLL